MKLPVGDDSFGTRRAAELSGMRSATAERRALAAEEAFVADSADDARLADRENRRGNGAETRRSERRRGVETVIWRWVSVGDAHSHRSRLK